MRELSWANKAQIDRCCHRPSERFYSNAALKMKWCDGYDCNNFIGAIVTVLSSMLQLGAIVTVLQCVTIGLMV